VDINKYCIIDTETTGPDKNNHRVVLFGLLYVDGSPVTDKSPVDVFVKTPYNPYVWGAVYLRQDFMELFLSYQPWTQEIQDEIDDNNGSIMGTSVPLAIQDTRDNSGRQKFLAAYDIHKISVQDTLQRGVSRYDALLQVHSILEQVKQDKIFLVGHNCVRFDIPFIQAEFYRYGLQWEPDPDFIIDTGAIVKGRQINAAPRDDERNIEFYRRVANTRAKGVTWSLDRYCVPKYELEKYGVDITKQHQSAGYDCFVTHCLLKAL
jgi:DNA polymerase III epsilon subunit-like protein